MGACHSSSCVATTKVLDRDLVTTLISHVGPARGQICKTACDYGISMSCWPQTKQSATHLLPHVDPWDTDRFRRDTRQRVDIMCLCITRLRRGLAYPLTPNVIMLITSFLHEDQHAQVVSSAGGHTLTLTRTGKVLSSGDSYWGKLGHGDAFPRDQPEEIKELLGHCVSQVAVGDEHSLVVTQCGKLWTFGRGMSWQLGHEQCYKQLHTPYIVEELRSYHVLQAAGGRHHSLALTSEGQVFSFGTGCSGQLGYKCIGYQAKPRLIESLSGTKIVQIAAGAYHSVFLTEDSCVFYCGSAFENEGSLENGACPCDDDAWIPKLVDQLLDIKVKRITAQGSVTTALATDGHLTSFTRPSDLMLINLDGQHR